MAGEQFLLSGDQIATFASSSVTFPGGVSTIQLNGLATLGDADSRFFLIRETGDGEQVLNGQFFSVYQAVDDGSGTLVPGASPIISANFATPDAYDDTGAGDGYLIFGLFGGTQFVVNLEGFEGASSFTAVEGQDTIEGGNGELELTEITDADPDGAICFCPGTPILTVRGEVPVECLKVGDLVWTLDNGAQPIRWIARSRVNLTPGSTRLRPIRISRGTLPGGLPTSDIMVSPAHQFLTEGAFCELFLGTDQALVAAKHLVNGSTVRPAHDLRQAEYWHFLFDRHEIVCAAGSLTESFFPGRYGLSTLDRETRDELFELFPGLRSGPRGKYGKSVRQVTHAHEARLLAKTLCRSGQTAKARGLAETAAR